MSEAPEDLRDLEQMHQDWLNAPTLSAAMQLPEVRALRDAAIALMDDFKSYKFNIMGDFYNTSKDRQFAPMTAALVPFAGAKP